MCARFEIDPFSLTKPNERLSAVEWKFSSYLIDLPFEGLEVRSLGTIIFDPGCAAARRLETPQVFCFSSIAKTPFKLLCNMRCVVLEHKEDQIRIFIENAFEHIAFIEVVDAGAIEREQKRAVCER